MIKYVHGNIFTSRCKILVNPVNAVGCMGAGLALQFKQRYPKMFELYKERCHLRVKSSDEMDPEPVPVFNAGDIFPVAIPEDGHIVINLATKGHWKNASLLSDIERGLYALLDYMLQNHINSVAIPALGCGLGGQDFNAVSEVIEEVFSSDMRCFGMHIEVYHPSR